jgi:hypothetical protein
MEEEDLEGAEVLEMWMELVAAAALVPRTHSQPELEAVTLEEVAVQMATIWALAEEVLGTVDRTNKILSLLLPWEMATSLSLC